MFDFIKYHEGEDGEPFFKGKPNFSRYFEIVYAGAGSGVGSYVMLDTRDGKVYDVTDLETSCDGYGNLSNGNNEFNLYSNIFEIENCEGGFGGTPKLFRYEWNDNLKKFVLINNTQ